MFIQKQSIVVYVVFLLRNYKFFVENCSKFYKLGRDDFEGHFILRVSIQKHPKQNL